MSDADSKAGEVAAEILGCQPVTWRATGHLWWRKPEREVCYAHGPMPWPCPWFVRAVEILRRHMRDVEP